MGKYNQYRKPWIKKETAAAKKRRVAKVLTVLHRLNPQAKHSSEMYAKGHR